MPKPPRGSYDKITEFFSDKKPTSAENFMLMEAEARLRAFAVANITKVEVVRSIRDELVKAIKEGATIEQFRERFQNIVRSWTDRDAWHADRVFRENIQQAYQYGRMEEMLARRDRFPYWRYIAILDSRVRPTHRALHGVTLPPSAPFWNRHYPPWEWNCRCTVQMVTLAEAERGGITSRRFRGPKPKGGYTSPGMMRAFTETPVDKRRFSAEELARLRDALAQVGLKI